MEYAIFNTPKAVADFFKEQPAKKMNGICSYGDGKILVFYTRSYIRYNEEFEEGLEEDE